MWVICIACHHHAEVKPLKKDARLLCSACGSRVVRKTAKLKSHMLNGGQTEALLAKVLTHAGLISIARERGYKVGWAAMKYRVIYGEWPTPPGVPPPEPQNPSPELTWWIKQQNIAYAKANFPREKDKPKELKPDKPSAIMNDEDWSVDL